ncbi:MAG: DNA translocase FtsK [Acidobacteriota bacterium]
MPRRKQPTKKKDLPPVRPTGPDAPRRSAGVELAAIGLLVAGLLCGMALFTHDTSDPSWGSLGSHDGEVGNAVGPFGANLSYALLQAFGVIAFALPLALVGSAIACFFRHRIGLGWPRAVGLLLLVLSAAALFELAGWGFGSAAPTPGGLIGHLLGTGLSSGLGQAGGLLVATALTCTSLLLLSQVSLQDALVSSGEASGQVGRGMMSLLGRARSAAGARLETMAEEREVRRQEREAEHAAREAEREAEREERRRKAAEAPKVKAPAAARAAKGGDEAQRPKRKLFNWSVRKLESPRADAAEVDEAPAAPPAPRKAGEERRRADRRQGDRRQADRQAEPAAAAAPMTETPPAAAPAPPPAPVETPAAAPAPAAAAASEEVGEIAVGVQTEVRRAVKKADPTRARDYRLPPIELLDEADEPFICNEQELLEKAQRIVERCAEFGVGGKVLQVHPGPVVTTYELKPDPGVKLSRIVGLEDDLAMALKAETIRIDRIPGKSTVGIEVPNRHREMISFRELVESEAFVKADHTLPMILGKTIDGTPLVADLAKQPHLLIAGSTGSGKSVCLNSVITSILYMAPPDQVKFIMVDPKMLELGMYREIPHLLSPVVTEASKASNALKWGVREMEQRYALLAGVGVRNISQFNAWIEKVTKETGEAPSLNEITYEKLPYIVIVIDELADLMMVAANDVEDSICRLAQMARAVGIHLILATQRPSVDVITGVIKANLPARIAMRVATKIDSRTILDTNGGEQLLGRGDMLFLPSGSSRLVRVHGPYLSEVETASVCDHLRKQLPPVYEEGICDDPAGATGGPEGIEDHHDELFDQAARIVVERGEASTSYLQRRLKVGYTRAARLVDMLEADGIVGPSEGSKVREVLVGADYFDEMERAKAATEV